MIQTCELPLPAVPTPRAPVCSSRRVAVIGGGISGLACALRLAKAGNQVTLFEASGQLGGLGEAWEHEGHRMEKFYHCMLPSDGPLLALLSELGLEKEIYWKPSTFAYAHGNRLHPLNTAADLLRFSPLGFWDRVRVGITGLFGRLASGKGLDEITAAEWLTRLSGRRAFNTFWLPMLQAKFGDRYHHVPALWFWTRFNREKGDRKGEVKGYLRGGYHRIVAALAEQLCQAGAEIRLHEPLMGLDLDDQRRPQVSTAKRTQTFDQAVLASPWPACQETAGPALRQAVPSLSSSIDYQGVINCVLLLRRPLTSHYWVATPEPGYPFDGVVETSTLTDEADRGSRHVVYLTKYLHRDDPRFGEAANLLGEKWWEALKRLFPGLKDEHLEARRVFRAPFVEPLWTTGYAAMRPPEELVPGRVFLASTVQVYPSVTSWNGSVAQADRTFAAIGASPPVQDS